MSKNKLSNISLAVALAGFLFGFDTVVISGANLPIKELWNTSPWFHGTFIMSMALWGTVLGAALGGFPTNAWGRKKTLIFIGILYAVSALGSALAPEPYSFSFFRFIGGIGVGVSSVAAPTYLSEISPANMRGRLVVRYQFMIVFGIMIAFFSNYLLKGVGGSIDWRLMLGVEAIPAVAYTIMVFFTPESPRWLLVHNGDEKGARDSLLRLGRKNIDQSIKAILDSMGSSKSEKVWKKRYAFPIILAFTVAFFNQLSGINFILYYAPEILERAGLASKESLMSAVSIGIINIIFTFLGMYLIDRVGRKKLLLWGSFGYIISLSMVAWAFFSGAGSGILLGFILLFMASHGVGQGAVIWVFIAEIFHNQVRAFGQSIGATTHWVFAALITLLTPVFLDEQEGIFGSNPWPIFAFFAIFMIIQLLFVILVMPETKGKSLEELEKELVSPKT